MRKRLHRIPRFRPLLSACVGACAALLIGGLLAGCDSAESDPLAPYEGGRPLTFMKVTQSFTPDLQWVGGRVAAVGINRGDRAALDSTLVWIRRAPSNSISSVVTVGPDMDWGLVESLGGTPQETLSDNETYTFWIAEASAFEVGLDPARMAPGAFADTTLTMGLVLLGRGGGDPSLGVQFRVTRNERILGDQYVITWTPEHVRFRRLAIRQATTGGFSNLIWHVAMPEDEVGGIAPPVVIGVAPEGSHEDVEFPETGFGSGAHTLWAVTENWDGNFLPSSRGYAFFQMFASNF